MTTGSISAKSIRHGLDHLQPSESVVLGGAALLVGFTSGAGVWLFKRLIDLAHLAAFNGLGAGLSHLGGWAIAVVPVVARDDPRRLLGVVRRSDIVRAYDVALTERAAMLHRAHQVRLGTYVASGFGVEEFTVQVGAPCAGRRISQVTWPLECVIATLRRGQQVLIPHGDTVLKPGDVLVAVVKDDARKTVQQLCRAGAEKSA